VSDSRPPPKVISFAKKWQERVSLAPFCPLLPLRGHELKVGPTECYHFKPISGKKWQERERGRKGERGT